jgi:hypothetical protein
MPPRAPFGLLPNRQPAVQVETHRDIPSGPRRHPPGQAKRFTLAQAKRHTDRPAGAVAAMLAHVEDARTSSRNSGRNSENHGRHWLGHTASLLGDLCRASDLLHERFDRYQGVGQLCGQAITLRSLGIVDLRAGRVDEAPARVRDAMGIWDPIGSPYWTAQTWTRSPTSTPAATTIALRRAAPGGRPGCEPASAYRNPHAADAAAIGQTARRYEFTDRYHEPSSAP